MTSVGHVISEKSISYDGNGNLSFYGVNTAGKHYVYDCENRMIKYYDTTSAGDIRYRFVYGEGIDEVRQSSSISSSGLAVTL